MDDKEILNFKSNISKFTNLDDEIKSTESSIKPLRQRLTELKKEKSELKTIICQFMDSNQFQECKLPNNEGSLVYKKRKLPKPITKELMRDEFRRFFCIGPGFEKSFNNLTDIEKAETLFNYIYENREFKISEVLMRKSL